MKDQNRTKKQLIDELNTLRRQIAELEASAAQRQPARETFQSSQTQYRTVFDSLEDAIHVIDSDFRLILFNKRFERWNGELGLETQVIGKNLFEVFPFLREHVRNEYIRVFDTGKMLITEEITTVDDREIITETRKIPIYTDGLVGWVVTVIRDITDRERVEKELRESETSFRELADLLPQSVFELDLKGNFTYSNRCGFETFGYTREDLEKGVNALELYIPEERERVEQNIRKRMTGEEFDDHEYTGLRKDGSIFPILVYSSPIIRDGKPVGVRGIVLDITDRKQVEEELRESEEKFEKAFHRNPSPMTISSLDGCFIDVNDAFALHLGYSREELIGQYASELGIFLDLPRREEKFERLAAQGGPFSADEVELRTKTGKTRWSLASYEIIEIRGEPFILGVGIDITQRKQTEEELREKQAKLLAQSRKLEEVNAALGVLLKRREEDKLELEENVLANVNDLVFPYLDRLRNSHLDPDQEILIEILESHLKDIISPFSARLSSRFSNLTPTEIQVASLIKDGKTTKEIASILNLSENTIISHRFHIRTKLGLRSRKMNLTSYLRSRHS